MAEEPLRMQIDEEWKRKAAEDRRKAEEELAKAAGMGPEDREVFPEVNFQNFVAGLATQALIALGQVENPLVGKHTLDLGQAKYVVDTLLLLREKTRNNLTPEEQRSLDAILYDLQTGYVQMSHRLSSAIREGRVKAEAEGAAGGPTGPAPAAGGPRIIVP